MPMTTAEARASLHSVQGYPEDACHWLLNAACLDLMLSPMGETAPFPRAPHLQVPACPCRTPRCRSSARSLHQPLVRLKSHPGSPPSLPPPPATHAILASTQPTPRPASHR